MDRLSGKCWHFAVSSRRNDWNYRMSCLGVASQTWMVCWVETNPPWNYMDFFSLKPKHPGFVAGVLLLGQSWMATKKFYQTSVDGIVCHDMRGIRWLWKMVDILLFYLWLFNTDRWIKLFSRSFFPINIWIKMLIYPINFEWNLALTTHL